MKEYLDFEDGEIKNESNGDFFDEDREIIDDNYYNEISIDEQKNDNYSNVVIDDTIDKKYLNILNVSNKDFIDGNYNYKDDTKESKKKKEKISKIKKEKKEISIVPFINTFLSICLKLFRCLFCLCIIILIYLLVLYFAMLNEVEEYTMTKEEENIIIIEEVIQEAKDNNDVESLSTYTSLKNAIIDYSNSLTEIVNGEILIINNLKNGVINEKDASNYFSKTLEKKDEMMRDLGKQNFPEELRSIQTLLNLMTTSCQNISKTIMNDYLVGNNTNIMVSNMSTFYNKYIENLTTLNNYLENL